MPGRRLDILLAALTLLTPFAIHLFFPVIPVVKADFGLTDAMAQLTFSIGVFGLAFSTLAYGVLGDRYGRRPVLFVGLALFVVGSIVAALATTFAALLIGRLVQAVGAGCGITLARAIARDVHGPDRLVKSIAFLTLFFALGGLLSPAIGGVLIDIAGWRSVFAFTMVTGLGVIIAIYFIIPETRTQAGPGGRPSMLSGLLELLRQPRFCALVIHTGASTATFLTLATASATFMRESLQRPSSEFGLYFAIVPIGFIIGTLISSRIGNRATVEQMVLIGASIALLAVGTQSSLLLAEHLTPLVLFVPGFFMTLAQGLSLPFAQAGAMATIPRLAGTAAGIGVFVQNFMGAGVAQIYGLVADGSTLPLVQITVTMALIGLAAAAVASLLRQPQA